MNTTPPLSMDAENRLIDAVKRAVDAVDGGATPLDAFTAVARTEKWGADMVRFAASVYNTGRQTAQRETGQTAAEKYASFPLVDASAVIARIYGPSSSDAAVKAATAVPTLPVSDEYSRPPTWLAARPTVKAATVKAAAPCPDCGNEPGARPSPLDPPKIWSQYRQLKEAAETARVEAARAYNGMLNALGDLSDYFSKSAIDRLPFNAVASAASAKFGKQASHALFSYVADRAKPWRSAGAPSAAHWAAAGGEGGGGTKIASLIEWDARRQPWSLVERAFAAGRTVGTARLAEKAAVDALEAHVRGPLAPLVCAPRVEKAAQSLVDGPQPDRLVYDNERLLQSFLPHLDGTYVDPTAARVKAAAAWAAEEAAEPYSMLKGGGLLQPIASAASAVSTKEMLERLARGGEQAASDASRSAYGALSDPAHESQLRGIRTQAMLADLMNDEVIGGFPPRQVASAYNEIASLAPRTSGQPFAARALLRRHLQENAEPYQAKEITDIEKGLADTAGPPAHMSPWAQSSAPRPAAKAAADYDLGIMPHAEATLDDIFPPHAA